ncbi:hypothetical protein [Mucilaginibacter antarcticus]
MVRGTFANVRIKNRLAKKDGGYSTFFPDGREMSVYDTAMHYKAGNIPLVVLAGKEYGSGSSRDWAAKGTFLLGVKVVIAESYERIHRSNLVGMGILPLQYGPGETAQTLNLSGHETYSFRGLESEWYPGKEILVTAVNESGITVSFQATARLDSLIEIAYYQHGGILQYVLRQFLAS